MRKSAAAALLLSFLLVGEPKPLPAQEGERSLDRILNPLPDYDPFAQPPPPPRFFPDEADRRAAAALIDSLTRRDGNLEDHLRFFIGKDAELKNERGTVTGLTEQIEDLFHNSFQERDRYLEAQRKALASASSPQRKNLIESRLKNDDLSQAEELMRKSSANRWGSLLNRLLSSVDLIGILSGSYLGAAIDSAMGQLLSLGSAEMPIEERKALVLYREHLRRYPDHPRNEEIQKQVEALEKKKNGVLVRKQLEKAGEAVAKGEWDRAALHYQIAWILDPSSTHVEKASEQLRNLLRRQEEARKIGLSLAADSPRMESDKDMRALLYALALRDPQQIEARAAALGNKYSGQPLAVSAREALSVALEIRGEHEEAKKILAEIARGDSPHERSRAKLLLESPDYNLLGSLHKAQSERRLGTVKYVLLGEDLLKRNLIYGTAPLAIGGPAGAASLAAANVLMIGTNIFEVLTANPISYQPVIDRAVAYIRNHPRSDSVGEVYKILAQAYEELGMYDKAVAYLEMSEERAEEKIAELKDKAAQALLRRAEKSGERDSKEFYLQTVLSEYPESPAAKEAARKLAALVKLENRGLRLSKQFLMEHPELHGPEGLGLKPSLFDGNLNNMELADQGVNLLSETELLLHFQTPWGIRSRTYLIRRETAESLQMALRRKNYELAISDVHTRPRGSPGGIKDLPPSLLRREPAKKDAEPEESTFRFVREATGPSATFPKVLDHELISESEKNPGGAWRLPPIQGNISARRFDLSGGLPSELWGERISVGADEKSPFAGLQLPVPLIQGFIPVDFLFQAGPGRFSLFPRIHVSPTKDDDQELYR